MNGVDARPPPRKKRRFFVDEPEAESDEASAPAPPAKGDASTDSATTTPEKPSLDGQCHPSSSQTNLSVHNDAEDGREKEQAQSSASIGFDKSTFEAFVGATIDAKSLERLREISGDNLERAINMYLDGSWKSTQNDHRSSSSSMMDAFTAKLPERHVPDEPVTTTGQSPAPAKPPLYESMPAHRYVGAFGVGAWATRSGAGLVKMGESVKIERTKIKPPTKMGRGGKPVQTPASRMRGDVIVRFTNADGEEVGRLPKDTANWVSTLIDQKICRFEGTCFYAPDRVRVNDTIELQLTCALLKQAFEGGSFVKPQDDNRTTGIFEEKETTEEKDLRQRQVALVKLFDEINLQPMTGNDTTAKHKKQGILQAAEIAEQYDKDDESGKPKATPDGSAATSDEEKEEGKELEQDQLDSLYKKAQSFDFDTPTMEPADTFAMDLRKYQKQALHWMVGKEKDEKSRERETSMHPLWEEYKWPNKDMNDQEVPRVTGQDSFYVNPYSGELSLDFPAQEQHCLGGILADEMGLGKTIEMLSLMHTHRSEVSQQASENLSSSLTSLPRLPKKSSSVVSAPCTTLVVAPMSLLAQWKSEAEKASKSGSLRVLQYYAEEKVANLQSLCCEANAASAPNLIITSYGSILSEFNQVASLGGDRGSHGGLFSLDYFRVILDEAHFIKNRQSKTAKACYELSAEHRWVLTGTPIVNRLEDLFSLVHFLRVEPWANFSFWKTFITVPFESKDFIRALDVVQTVLEPLVMRRTKDMQTPDGQALVPLPPRTIEIEEIQLSKQEREVYDYIFTRAKRTFNATMEAGTLLKSYTTIFAQILRLRQSCCHPVLTRNKAIVAEEEEAAAAADVANGLADDMDLQELIERFTSDSNDSEEDVSSRFGAHVLQQIQSEADNECPICSEEPMIDRAVTGCWHSACKNCLLDYIEHQKGKNELPLCFNCRKPINQRDTFEVIRHDEPDDDKSKDYNDLYDNTLKENATSTPSNENLAGKSPGTPHISLRRIGSQASAKIAALVTHLQSERKTKPGMKSVVFSQFTSFLDLISAALTSAGIPQLRFDGSMAQKQRAAVLTQFTSDCPPTAANTSRKLGSSSSNNGGSKGYGTVLLLSLRAGGVGLNLTAAKRVYMMDPWWSFAVEAQAIDRVHRMGQTEEVKVTRFIVGESIEGRMLKIQERKKFIASSLGMMSEEEKRTQRIEDIKELLS